MLKLIRLTAALSTTVLALSIPRLALAQPLSEMSDYPAAPTSNVEVPFCYLQTQGRVTFDLSRLCGVVPAQAQSFTPSGDGYVTSGTSTYIPTRTSRGSGFSGSSGVCNYPSDIAADGRRCGGRAASVRPGGRYGGDGSMEIVRPETLRPEMLRPEQTSPFGNSPSEQRVRSTYPSDSLYRRGLYRSTGTNIYRR